MLWRSKMKLLIALLKQPCRGRGLLISTLPQLPLFISLLYRAVVLLSSSRQRYTIEGLYLINRNAYAKKRRLPILRHCPTSATSNRDKALILPVIMARIRDILFPKELAQGWLAQMSINQTRAWLWK